MLFTNSLRLLYSQQKFTSYHIIPPFFSIASSFSFRATSMESQSSVLILCGKSSTEIDVAKRLKNENILKLPDNGDISVRLYSETDHKPNNKTNEFSPGVSFNVENFMNSLSTTNFGRLLIWSPRLSSTHDVVSHNFVELPIGSVCVADVQFKGRGRSKNVWESPAGCLLFSFTIEMEDGRVVPLLQYVVSLAITEGIKNVCDKNGLPQLDVRIKWPNDLYLNGLKVGGILCTSTYKSRKFNVSAGIGLNVDNRQPTTCLNARLEEMTSIKCRLQREDIIASFFNNFEKYFDIFRHQGFQPLEELYYRAWLHSGQRVIVQETCDDKYVDNTVTIQGLTSSGYLKARADDGQMCELHPDGNSFDFFKGLVRRKLE